MLNPSSQLIAYTVIGLLTIASGTQSTRLIRAGLVVAGAIALSGALLAGEWGIAVACGLLIGANVLRLLEIGHLQMRVKAARDDKIDPRDFEEHFKRERHARGDMLFLKGNPGDYAYYIAAGEITIPEVSAQVGPGEFFGEFSLFTDSGLRTASAVCRTDVELYRIDSKMLAETFHRKPDFAFALVRLIVQRMNRNNERLSAENAKLRLDRQLSGPGVI